MEDSAITLTDEAVDESLGVEYYWSAEELMPTGWLAGSKCGMTRGTCSVTRCPFGSDVLNEEELMRSAVLPACALAVRVSTGAAQSSMKLDGKIDCAKPEPMHVVEVKDAEKHAMMLGIGQVYLGQWGPRWTAVEGRGRHLQLGRHRE